MLSGKKAFPDMDLKITEYVILTCEHSVESKSQMDTTQERMLA